MTITEFLTERLDEDEQTAQAVHMQSWTLEDYWLDGPGFRVIASVDPASMDPADADHIARHDPARVLAQVAAMRAIVDLADETTGLDMMVDSERRVGPRDTAAEPYVGDVMLRHLAAIWSDHDDYDPAWAPDASST